MASARVLQNLQGLAKLPSPGPAPAFTHIHISRALLAIGDEGPIGRIELSRELGLGEGAIRTIIRHLTLARVIVTARGGCVLTRRGLSLYNLLKSKLSKPFLVDAKQLALDKVSAAVLIKGAGHLVNRGIEQRDAAIRAGATGACTLVFRAGEFVMPMSENEEWKLSPDDSLFQELRKSFDLRNNDAVTIVSAPEKGLAENGAIAAALTLIE
jgi:predicted transcriptional regulator